MLQDLLQEQTHLINCLDSWGRTPLHAAAITSDSKCLKLLLINSEIDVNAKCGPRGDDKTALHISAEHGHLSNIQLLLGAGASFILKDSNGLTALDLSERAGHKKCVEEFRLAVGEFYFHFQFFESFFFHIRFDGFC